MKKTIYTIISNGVKYHFTNKRSADRFFINEFLEGKHITELKS